MRKGSLLDPRVVYSFLTAGKKGSLAKYAEGLINRGLDHIEITGDIFTFLGEEHVQKFRDEVNDGFVQLKKERSITFSLHLPIVGSIDLSTSIAPLRTTSIEVLKKVIGEVSSLEPISYVLHVVGMLKDMQWAADHPIMKSGLHGPMIERVLSSMEEVVAETGKNRLCVENLEAMSFRDHAAIVEASGVKICLDVGHYMIYNKRGGDLADFIERYSDKLGHIHLHTAIHKKDDEGKDYIEDHRGLNIDGGILDFNGFMDKLISSGFDGPIVLEVLRDTAEPSVDILVNKVKSLQSV